MGKESGDVMALEYHQTSNAKGGGTGRKGALQARGSGVVTCSQIHLQPQTRQTCASLVLPPCACATQQPRPQAPGLVSGLGRVQDWPQLIRDRVTCPFRFCPWKMVALHLPKKIQVHIHETNPTTLPPRENTFAGERQSEMDDSARG